MLRRATSTRSTRILSFFFLFPSFGILLIANNSSLTARVCVQLLHPYDWFNEVPVIILLSKIFVAEFFFKKNFICTKSMAS